MHIVSIANGDHNDIENKTPYHETDIYYGTIFALKKNKYHHMIMQIYF